MHHLQTLRQIKTTHSTDILGAAVHRLMMEKCIFLITCCCVCIQYEKIRNDILRKFDDTEVEVVSSIFTT